MTEAVVKVPPRAVPEGWRTVRWPRRSSRFGCRWCTTTPSPCSPPMSSILLADDHSLVRVGLAELLDGTDDLRVVGQAENGRGAVEPAAELRPDVILMDLSMPVMDGVEATRELVRQRPARSG